MQNAYYCNNLNTSNMIDNPFLLYGYEGPEYFCDREEETQQLVESMNNGTNIALISPRRLGKSGLIHHTFRYIKEHNSDFRCFYIDLYPTRSLSDFVNLLGKAIIGQLDTPIQKAEGFVTRFFRSTKLTFGVDPFTNLPQMSLSFAPQNSQQTLEEIFAYIAQSNVNCYIALDEFQQIAEYPEDNVEALLRSFLERIHNVHIIFSGSKQHVMDVMFSSPKHPFYRSTERMQLGALNEDKYYTFAQYHLQQKNVRLSKDIFHHIYSMVDGVTWYIQAIMHRLYRQTDVEVTEAVVQQAIVAIIRSEEEDYKKLYHHLTQVQATLLRAVAVEGEVKQPTSGQFVKRYHLRSASSVQRALAALLEEEYLYPTESGYIVYDRFMAIWLRNLE